MSDIHGETDPLTTDQDTTPTESPAVMIQPVMEGPRTQETREESTVPPPGFQPFQWPQADWDDIGDATLDPGLKFVTSWSARIMEERSSPPPLVPLSPITAEDSRDSIVVQTGTPTSEVYNPIGPDRIRSVHRRRPRRPLKMSTQCEKPAPADDFIFRDILCETAMMTNRSLSETITSLSSSPGEGLCFQTYDLQCGGPRSSRGRTWCSVKPSPLPGVAGRSRIGLVLGNESRPMV